MPRTSEKSISRLDVRTNCHALRPVISLPACVAVLLFGRAVVISLVLFNCMVVLPAS